MTESDIWKAGVKYLQANGYMIHCGCPPGASAYLFKNCNLIYDDTLDAPDIIFSLGNKIYFCECKPSLQALGTKNRNNENDFEKLERLTSLAQQGYYNLQLEKNYEILLGDITRFIACICYAGESKCANSNYAQLVIGRSGVSFIDVL